MTLLPLPAFQDNYIWIISDKDSSLIWAVDPGDAQVVSTYCAENNSKLGGILITHHHRDHTGGVAKLKEQFQCPVYGPKHLTDLITHGVDEGDSISVLSNTFHVLATPGHTLDHLCYVTKEETPRLLCGDTLFKGGCGRIMEGTAEMMLAAMAKLSHLPDNTLVYCTHEYTLANYRFALSLEPNNEQLINSISECEKKRQHNEATLPSLLSLEKATNPFLRSHLSDIQQHAAKQLSESVANDPVASFSQVRRAKDTFS
ncbi:hydroxyacylglutathione hydrolase [Marinomonas transparens]|uniref:Hydroxyacylglutathione hydrolase n=1 Tax=Marinomonas transparens TaxID=2795388 RepID=A0A934JX28_9GAMM|nr:hydroxyacylglutathione hydrolase [Marinomonas transparens]MBJ7538865.1 hydroxyacylglutathione hydrolase [Marinomonas transparens]